jgi:hypothetical protein
MAPARSIRSEDSTYGRNSRTTGNGQLTLVRRPSAVSGAQPHNVTRIHYDELSRPYRLIEAEGDAAQSTTQLDYDLDGGLTAVREGLESSPRVTTTVLRRLRALGSVHRPIGQRHDHALRRKR